MSIYKEPELPELKLKALETFLTYSNRKDYEDFFQSEFKKKNLQCKFVTIKARNMSAVFYLFAFQCCCKNAVMIFFYSS